MADVDGWPRSVTDHDLVTTGGVGLTCVVTDTARGRTAGTEGKVTPKILFGSPSTGTLTGSRMTVPVVVCGRGACLTLKRGEGESSASHQVSADNQRSRPFDFVGALLLRTDLTRTGAAPETKFGVEMDVLSWGCDRCGWFMYTWWPRCDDGAPLCASVELISEGG